MSETPIGSATPTKRVLDGNNLIPISNLVVLVTICAGGAAAYTELRRDVKELKYAVEQLADGEWSRKDMRHYVELLQAANRGLPDVVFPEVSR